MSLTAHLSYRQGIGSPWCRTPTSPIELHSCLRLPSGMQNAYCLVNQGVFRRIYELLLEDGVISRHQVGVPGISPSACMTVLFLHIPPLIMIAHPGTALQVHRPEALPDDETLQLVSRMFSFVGCPGLHPSANTAVEQWCPEGCGRFTPQSLSGPSAAGRWTMHA